MKKNIKHTRNTMKNLKVINNTNMHKKNCTPPRSRRATNPTPDRPEGGRGVQYSFCTYLYFFCTFLYIL